MAEDGNIVKVHYTGTLEDGSVFDSSAEREPLEFTIGAGRIIPGFENAVRDMQVGQSKTFTIPAQEAYGAYRDDLTLTVERSELPEGVDPQVGQQLQMQQPNGNPVVVTVTEASETSITLDANHPLAGKDLTFEVELVEVK
jgi:peptidylprolyl isomerase